MYVDDGLTGGTEEQINRFSGKKTAYGCYNWISLEISKLGNFIVKAFSISGQKVSEESSILAANAT